MLVITGLFLLGALISFIEEGFTPYTKEMQIELRKSIQILSMQEEIQKECERNQLILAEMTNWRSSNRYKEENEEAFLQKGS